MKLYTYFRSSAAYRVRIALGLKGLAVEAIPVHLRRGGGEQLQPVYRSINPSASVPALELDGQVLTQSLAIIEYLDEVHPQPPLLPATPLERARVRALALLVACDIHPLNNLRVLRHLVHDMDLSEQAKDAWYAHWVTEGLGMLEQHLVRDPRTGTFCHGEQPGLADCVLVPQVFNARRAHVDTSPFPTIERIDAACRALPAFQQAHPSVQPDAEE
jgi:maleylacetoacetate isomerase